MSSGRTKKAKADPCAHEDCGSRRFYVGDDGYTYCDQGHRQSERGTVIAEDTGELVTPGRKSRRKDSDAASTTSRASSFGGADALEHYLLCVQLVLRKQLRWLIDIQKLPEELETLVKDLWALRLQKMQGKMEYESETDTERPSSSSQQFSSQSESEGQAGSGRSSRRSRAPNRMRAKDGTPNLLETLSLCYIGILLLRIPITVADILDWTSQGDMIYYRTPREVPMGMRERLPAPYQGLLEPQDLIPPGAMHADVLNILRIFSTDFGMTVPPINTPILLYRWVKAIVLPIEVFAATQRLTKILDFDVDFVLSSGSGKRQLAVLRYPEVQLMAFVVVSTKLLFPLDHHRERKAKAASDLSALALDWEAWTALHEGEEERRKTQHAPLTFEQAFKFKESDCLGASEEKLDAYLEWCENNIASEEIREYGPQSRDANFRTALFTGFPMHTQEDKAGLKPPSSKRDRQATTTSRTHVAPSKQRLTDETAPEDTPSVGSSYRRFRSVDELSGSSEVLFSKAAKLAGVSLEGMVQAVFSIERKLQKHEEWLRKEGGFDHTNI